jgi:signal transduction histidine kinase
MAPSLLARLFDRPATLRTHLIKLILVGLAPLLLFSIGVILLFVNQQQATLTGGLQETARALSGALQQEFDASIFTLEALASSGTLDNRDVAEFRGIAARVLSGHVTWAGLSLFNSQGQQVFQITKSGSAPADLGHDSKTLDRVLLEARPLTGNFSGNPAPMQGCASIYVPVLRENKLIYVLSAAIERRSFVNILVRQKLAPQWIGTITDRNKTIVARTRDPERFVGKTEGPLLRNTASGEGIFRGETLEGVRSYAAMSTLARSGWSVALTVPASQVMAPLWHSLAYVIGAGLVSLLACVGLASFLAGRIAEPIRDLSRSARALGNDDFNRDTPTASTIIELNAVAQDLQRAAELLSQRSNERDRVEAELRSRDQFLESQAAVLRRSEEALLRQAAELEQQLLASGRLVAVGELTASMAHEFNNPLGVILGFAQGLLAEMDRSEPYYHYVEIIAEETRRCERLVQELLEFGRPRSVEFAPVQLKTVLDKTLDLVSNRASKSGVNIVVNIAPELPPIHGDAQQLQQVLLNLSLNSVDAMPRGGVLTWTVGTVDSTGVVLAVEDNGFGIQPDILPRIFQPFVTANKRRGLGLGLPISDRIVKAHGGRIEVESTAGQGTIFKIYLPINN